MTQPLTLVMGQINPLVGDVAGNMKQILLAAQQARETLNADLVVFPELTLTGYPPEDLLLRPGLIKRVSKAMQTLAAELHDIAVIIGHPQQTAQGLFNAASLIADGKIKATYFKQQLPNYSVFDEKRYFQAGSDACVVEFQGLNLGLSICEDIWFEAPAALAAAAGADVLINLNASPFHQHKATARVEQVTQRAKETGLAVVYVNQVGGQDELVFDGASFAVSAQGEIKASAAAFASGLFPISINKSADGQLEINGQIAEAAEPLATVYQALVTGLRDYIEKNRFPGVVIGLSGGIDSALTLALAVDAIGAERVKAVMMPSRYTAQMSLDDAELLAQNLAVDYSVISIEPTFNAFLDSLAETFNGRDVDTTEENIQARCRGVILMAISNKTGAMVLSTGNKSEMAVGYSTLYGDMAGGYAPLKDVYKTLVYQLCDYRNQLEPVIPQRIITRPPSAELAEAQLDQDSLPAYETLDAILEQYVVNDQCFEDMVDAGFDAEMLARVIKMIDRNEYKRRQAPPGIRITARAFGRDRRYPITSGYAVNSMIE